MTRPKLPPSDTVKRILEERRDVIHAHTRRVEEFKWWARSTVRGITDESMRRSVRFDMRPTEEELEGEADTIFAELQAKVSHEPLARQLAEVHAQIAQDNVRLRACFVDEVEVLPTFQAAELVGEDMATLDRWREERRIIGVPVGAAWLFPAFQFKDGAPRPVIARALGQLPAERSPWASAFWFVSSNSWLGGPAPTRFLEINPDAVVWAAERENEPIGG